MAGLRFRQRHVHQTLVDHIKATLIATGWVSAPVNFATTPVTVIDFQPQVGGVTVAPNTVAVTLGSEDEDLDEELGAGLISCEHMLFVDIYGADGATATSIAADLKDGLKHRIVPLRDYTTNPAGVLVPGAQLEMDGVLIETPAVATTNVDKRFWRVVKATATLYTTE